MAGLPVCAATVRTWAVLGRVAGDGERTHGAAVETRFASDDLQLATAWIESVSTTSGELQRRLICRGSILSEEDFPLHAGQRQQLLGQLQTRLVRVEIAGVQQLAGLLRNGGSDARITMTQRAHGDARQQVGVLVAVDIPDLRADSVAQL